MSALQTLADSLTATPLKTPASSTVRTGLQGVWPTLAQTLAVRTGLPRLQKLLLAVLTVTPPKAPARSTVRTGLQGGKPTLAQTLAVRTGLSRLQKLLLA
eukprot:1136410-Pelagomonas_calceolata.AAC.2